MSPLVGCGIFVALCILSGVGLIIGGIYGVARPLGYFPAEGILLNCTEQDASIGEYTQNVVNATVECRTFIGNRTVSSIRQVLSGTTKCDAPVLIKLWVNPQLYHEGKEWWCSEAEFSCPRSVGGWSLMIITGSLIIVIVVIIMVFVYRDDKRSEYQQMQ